MKVISFVPLVSDASKTGDDVATEGRILSEMLEIVQKRDSLIARLEADRQRCGWLANMPRLRRQRPQKKQCFFVLLLWLVQLAVAWALAYVVVGLLLPDPES